MNVIIGILSALVLLLLVIRLRQNKSQNIPSSPPPTQLFEQNMPQYRYEQSKEKYADVKSAPDLSILDKKWK